MSGQAAPGSVRVPDRSRVWAAAGLFAAVLSALKLLQAARLQNQAYDLGIYANVLWNTAHGRWFQDSIKGIDFLGDHFSPGLALLAPLLLAWPRAAALTVAQSVALALGLPAVHRLAWDRTRDRGAAAAFALLYAVSPLVHEVSRYDAHATAFAVPLLLWGLVLSGRPGLLLLAAAGTLQEDMWLCAAAAAWHRGERRAASAFAAAFVAAVAALRVIGGGFTPAHWSFYDPARVLAGLGSPGRLAGLARLLVPLGGLPLLGGTDALPLLVPLGYTLLGSNPHQENLTLQYGAPLIPFAFLAAAAGWARLRRRPAAALLVPALLSLPFLPKYTAAPPPERTAAAAGLFAAIPGGVPVCASFDLVPPVALREGLRLWARGEDPAGFWIALDASPFAFRANPRYESAVAAFVAARRDRVVYERDGLYLLRPAAAP